MTDAISLAALAAMPAGTRFDHVYFEFDDEREDDCVLISAVAADPDPIEIISPNPDTSPLEGRISTSRDRTDAMIAPRQPTPTPTAADHRTPKGGPWPPGGVSWVGGRAR